MEKLTDAIGIVLFESDDFGGPKIVGGYLPHPKGKQGMFWSY